MGGAEYSGEIGGCAPCPAREGNVAESELLIPCGREERGSAGSGVSGGGGQRQIERAVYGRAGMHGSKEQGTTQRGCAPLDPALSRFATSMGATS